MRYDFFDLQMTLGGHWKVGMNPRAVLGALGVKGLSTIANIANLRPKGLKIA